MDPTSKYGLLLIALGSNKLEASNAALRLTVLYHISVDVIQPFKVSIILALIAKHFALRGEECFGKINICFFLESPFKIIINKFKCHPGDWETSLFASKGSWPAGPVNICINFLSGMKKQNLVYNSCPGTVTIEIWKIIKPQSLTDKMIKIKIKICCNKERGWLGLPPQNCLCRNMPTK